MGLFSKILKEKSLEKHEDSAISLTALPAVEIHRPASEIALQSGEDETEHHLTGTKLYLVVSGLCISVLLVALVCPFSPTFTVCLLRAVLRTKQY